MPEPSAVVVEMTGPIERADIPVLCERLRVALQAGTAEMVVCDVGGLADPDCVAVDALARLQLIASRLGRRLVLREVSPELQALLGFCGLKEVLSQGAGSGVEARRQPE